MSTAKTAVGIIVGLLVFGLLAAILLPVGVDAFASDRTSDFNVSTSDTVDITPQLNATVDSTNANSNATLTLATSDQSIQKTINQGSNATYSFSEGDVVVEVTNAASSFAEFTVDHPDEFSMSDGAASMWNIIPLFMVLGVLLFAIRVATSEM